MKLASKNIQIFPLKILLSILYGIFVYVNVSSWSFDYEAIVKTIEYFQRQNLSFIAILGFNSFSTYGLTKALVGYPAEFIASLFYGLCACIRFLVYSLLLPAVWFIPIFLSMAVMLDFNMSRYSLATTLFIFLFGVLKRNNLHNMGIWKTGLTISLFFLLHHFSAAFIALFSRTNILFRLTIISLIPIFVFFLSSIFSRFLSETDGDFPRITYVYFALTLISIIGFKINKNDLKPFISIIALLLSFQLSGIQFNSAYYTRFAFLVFEVTLITIALNTTAFSFRGHRTDFNIKYIRLLIVCFISTLYQVILINGNIWRFF